MKKLLMFSMLLACYISNAQSVTSNNGINMSSMYSVNSSGGDVVSSGGAFSYSIGQVFTTATVNSDGSMHEGVQQSLPTKVSKQKPVGIPEVAVTSYPNPVDEFFIIRTKGAQNQDLSYRLYNLNGQLLRSDNLGRTNTKVTAAGLETAVYLLYIMQNGKHLKTLKIIKR